MFCLFDQKMGGGFHTYHQAAGDFSQFCSGTSTANGS